MNKIRFNYKQTFDLSQYEFHLFLLQSIHNLIILKHYLNN